MSFQVHLQLCVWIMNPLKPKLAYFFNPLRTSKKTHHFITLLTMFMEVVTIYTENHMKRMNATCKATDC
jgi:hypothetical protein